MSETSAVWDLPCAVVEKILLKCEVQDFASCRSVCRSWRRAGSGARFWSQYFPKAVDMGETDDEEMLREFEEGFCYWAENWEDARKDGCYIFSMPLVKTKAGFATIKECNLLKFTNAHEELVSKTYELMRLGKFLDKSGAYAWSESCYNFVPIMFPFDPALPWLPDSIVRVLGVHEHLCNYMEPMMWPGNGVTRESLNAIYIEFREDWEEDTIEHLDNYFGEDSLVFYVGGDMCNPVPYLILKQLTSGVVGGLLTALIHT